METTYAFLFSQDGDNFNQHSTGMPEADVLAHAARVLREQSEAGTWAFMEVTGDDYRDFRVMTTNTKSEWVWKRES